MTPTETDSNGPRISGTVFFEKIRPETPDGPFAEAAFQKRQPTLSWNTPFFVEVSFSMLTKPKL